MPERITLDGGDREGMVSDMKDDEQPRGVCCETFREALKPGTDNEGFGPLIYDGRQDYPMQYGEWLAGSISKPIRFCPWCGKPKGSECAK